MRIAVWPDGEWCELSEVEQYSHKSDDYSTFTVDSEQMAERIAEEVARGRR